MTLDYTKMFLIVTEEAVVKGHFTRRVAADNACSAGQLSLRQWVPLGNVTFSVPKGALFFAHFWGCCASKSLPLMREVDFAKQKTEGEK